VAVLYAVVHEDPAALEPAPEWDLGPLERVLRKGMARDRAARFPTVLAFTDALEAALVEGGALGRPTVGAPLPLVPGARERDGRAIARARLRRRRRTRLRRGVQMLMVASVVVAGALCGGLARGKARASWRHLHGLFAERAAPNPNEGGPR
jgi:hypothetical protein